MNCNGKSQNFKNYNGMDPINPKKYRFNNAKDPENRTYYIKFAHDKNSLLHMEITVKRLLKKTNKIDIFIRYHSIFLATLKLERHESSCAVQ